MKNTLENKAKFFALYWGIEETGSDNYTNIMPDTWNEFPSFIGDQYLILKPLSSISDEDAINGVIRFQGLKVDNEIIDIKRYKDSFDFSIIHNGNNFKTLYSFFHFATNPSRLKQHYVDYLRSRRYALPWMNLSVEELIEYGWVKLKSE